MNPSRGPSGNGRDLPGVNRSPDNSAQQFERVAIFSDQPRCFTEMHPGRLSTGTGAAPLPSGFARTHHLAALESFIRLSISSQYIHIEVSLDTSMKTGNRREFITREAAGY